MAFDAICLRSVLHEMHPLLEGAKIEKVQQPASDCLIFSVRGRNGSRRMLVSLSASGPRLQFTDSLRENPAQPPMFCMLLRKHLVGARILGVSQPGGDRVVRFELMGTDELGDAARRTMVVELMGRYSNLMLLDADERIIDSLRRVDAEMNPSRQILPGLLYRLPEGQGKLGPEETTPEILDNMLSEALPEGRPADKWLLDRFAWLSPVICREIVWRVTGSTDCPVADTDPAALRTEILRLREMVLSGTTGAWLLTKKQTDSAGHESAVPADYAWIQLFQYGPSRLCAPYSGFSALLDDFYAAREQAQALSQKAQGIRKVAAGARDRLAKKLDAQKQELSAASKREEHKRLGDLIMGSIWKLEKGMKKATVIDFTDPECPEVEITLDTRKTPQQNAQYHYKQYTRLKHAEQVLTQMITDGERELEYLESVLEELQRCTCTAELAEIRTELWQNGYASQKWAGIRGSKSKEKPLPPFTYVTPAGMYIYAGRNNRQNEQLTLHTAARGDYWFHAQKVHGSHVILDCRGGIPDEESMTIAAGIAALHSAAADSQNVPVDYTRIKNVKKQPGGKTGMVLYVQYQTAYVTPSAEALGAMLRK